MNRLKVVTLTPELLDGPTFELMKGSCKSLVELEYFFKEVYKATTDQLDWNNPEVTKTKAANYGHIKWIEDLVPNTMWSQVPGIYSRCLLQTQNHCYTKLQIVEWHNYNHLDWITVRRDDEKLYTFKEDQTLNEGKLIQHTPIPETALDDRLKGIQMKYLPQTIWRQSDRDKAGAMIQAIDKQLKTRRIMRSLEKFVGGRPYEGDFRLPQKTIRFNIWLSQHNRLKLALINNL
ncbi:hypothetical protein Tco_0307044 [Tanacetum coccineum]